MRAAAAPLAGCERVWPRVVGRDTRTRRSSRPAQSRLQLEIPRPGRARPLRLLLQQNPGLEVGGGAVSWLGRGGVLLPPPQPLPATNCFYRGVVRGHAHSLVALNTCAGLTGVLRLAAPGWAGRMGGQSLFTLQPAGPAPPSIEEYFVLLWISCHSFIT